MKTRAVAVRLIRRIIPRIMRNALRRPATTARRLYAKITYALRGSVEVTLPGGWTVACHPICVPEFSVFQRDPAQRAELLQFVRTCSGPIRLVDAGAHWGLFSLAALRFGEDESRVICIEPSNPAARILRANLRLNKVLQRAHIVLAAAGDTVGVVDMLTTGAGGADYFVIPSTPRADTLRVRQVTIDHVCLSLNFSPTHLKFDIEGFEEEGLSGATTVLARYRPIVFLELHGQLIRRRNRDPRSVLQILRTAGYETWQDQNGSVTEQELASMNFDARIVCWPPA